MALQRVKFGLYFVMQYSKTKLQVKIHNKEVNNTKRYWLAQRRTELGLKSCEVAEALGISQASYCLVEQGKRQQKMTLPFALALANVLRLTVEEVIAREGLR